MKKISSILLSSFYLSLVFGMSVSVHYCMETMVSVALMSPASKCCCGDKGKANDCCDDEQYLFQYDTGQKLTTVSRFTFENKDISITEQQSESSAVLANFSEEVSYIQKYRHPPPKKPAVWLVNCSLTLYG